MRVVFDTNVVVSAFLSATGAPARLFGRWERHAFDLVVSEPPLQEYRRALLYDRVASRHGMMPEEVAEAVDELRQFALLVEPREKLSVIPEDPDDDRILECAVEGASDYVVSGDRHLLRLQTYRGIPILSPAAFLAVLAQESGSQP